MRVTATFTELSAGIISRDTAVVKSEEPSMRTVYPAIFGVGFANSIILVELRPTVPWKWIHVCVYIRVCVCMCAVRLHKYRFGCFKL